MNRRIINVLKTEIRRLTSRPSEPTIEDAISVASAENAFFISDIEDVESTISDKISADRRDSDKPTINRKIVKSGYTSPTLRTDIISHLESPEAEKKIQGEADISKEIIDSSNTLPTNEISIPNEQDLQDVADKIQIARRIIVFVGAGISTNCGIPVSPT